MPAISVESQLPKNAVRMDFGTRESAEQSLRTLGAKLPGKVVFCKLGRNFYALQDGTTPGRLTSAWRRRTGSTSLYVANSEVGAQLARHFPGGPGEQMQSKMNRHWIKRSVNPMELVAALDQDINDRVLRIGQFIMRQAIPMTAFGIGIKLPQTSQRCHDYLNEIDSGYKKGIDSAHDDNTNSKNVANYAQARARLWDLELQYIDLNGRQRLNKTHASTVSHLANKSAANGSARTPMNSSSMHAWWTEQTPETVEKVNKWFEPHLNDKQRGEIAKAQLATRRTWSEVTKLQCDPTALKAFVQRQLDRAHVVNQSKSLTARIESLRAAMQGTNKQEFKVLDARLKDVRYLPTPRMQLDELQAIAKRASEFEKQYHGHRPT